MTFAVPIQLREAAMKKANDESINMSEYLRKHVEKFVYGDKQRSAKEIMKSYGK